MNPLAIFNWSGGKDSALALYQVQQQQNQFDIYALCTTLSQAHYRVTMHGVREELMRAQATALGLRWQPLYLPESADMETYNWKMKEAWQVFIAAGVQDAFFGDIYLEDLRAYREQQLAEVGVKARFPLWGQQPGQLLEDFWRAGFKAKVVCVNSKLLDKSFVGRELDERFLHDLPDGVDLCGENGEYHSFVYDGPNFKAPVPVQVGEVVFKSYAPAKEDQEGECFSTAPLTFDTGFWFADLLPG